MLAVLSPRELADAIGVSESSVKRWVDDGVLQASRTAGGHRRIAISESVRFIRERRLPVLRPEVLGLIEGMGAPGPGVGDLADQLYQALLQDESVHARGLVLSAFLGGATIAGISDGAIRGAMARIGERWQHGPEGIVQEHRATDTCLLALNTIRALLPPAAPAALGALGCSPSADPHLIPSLVAGAVLSEEGFGAANLGPDTPAEALIAAMRVRKPRLVWISFSAPVAKGKLEQWLAPVIEELGASKLVVGGRGIERRCVPSHGSVAYCASMTELAAYARGVLS